jgi:2-polyprenyl-6-methoxyphenol hydroxylase-like FAD-dependent oxidoreductase
MSQLPEKVDVVVVGAGPTGLLLAGDLAEAGVGVTILERRLNEPNVTRALAVHARTMEILESRGLAHELARTGTRVRTLQLFGSVRINLAALPSEFNSVLITPQYETERVLQRRLDRLGVNVVRGAEVTGLTQDAQGVDIAVHTAEGADAACRASYVVGSDGVNSTVRAALGIPFPGRPVVKSIMLADVRLTSPPSEVLTVDSGSQGFAFLAPFGDGWYRIFAWNRHHQVDDSAPVELDEIREVTRSVLGTDFGMHDARWLSRFHSDERQVPSYRVGRVFLAGDAAHCHSPAGGQGMNTGMQDAANLGWKLAAAVHGWGGDQLLDTYHTERHRIGRDVLRSSGVLIRLALITSWPGRHARNILAWAALRLPPIAATAVGSISGIGLRYPAPRGADRRVGSRAPNIPLVNGRLYDALRGGRFILVGTDAAQLALPPQVDPAIPARPTGQLVLVRPDGYLAWMGTAAGFPIWARHYFTSSPAVIDPGLSDRQGQLVEGR